MGCNCEVEGNFEERTWQRLFGTGKITFLNLYISKIRSL